MASLDEIQQVNPEAAEDSTVIAASKAFDDAEQLASFVASPQGKKIIEELKRGVGEAMVELFAVFDDPYDQHKLHWHCAQIKARLGLLREYSTAQGAYEEARSILEEMLAERR